MRRPSQNGLALVITLIMLAAVTAMAIIFLGLSRRERSAVAVVEDYTSAQLMAEAALVRAQADTIARMAAQDDVFAYDLLVSTNFISPVGFLPGIADPENVSYVYANGNVLDNANDQRRNLANLLYDPRPPVFIRTNPLSNSEDFRFWLDINRNGLFETNGIVEVRSGGRLMGFDTLVGEPEWIGVLQNPEYPHSGSNRFVGRYAFIALPAGKTLDLNYIHNVAGAPTRPDLGGNPIPMTTSLALAQGYRRNMGVGSWEINLAAFLDRLMPQLYQNEYIYSPGQARGDAFYNAFDFLTYRYLRDLNTLRSINQLSQIGVFPTNAPVELTFNGVDNYGDGVLLRGVENLTVPGVATTNDTGLLWSGTENRDGLLNHQDLFALRGRESGFSSVSFQDRLALASSDLANTEHQYVLPALLSQMGMDSLPPRQNKLNLNYNNVTYSGTSYVPWTRLSFFTNTVNRLLERQYGQVLTNGIQVWPTNHYSSAVHRLLQLSANILDGTMTNYVAGSTNDYPSVFRPIFERRDIGGATNSSLFITGYTEVTDFAVMGLPAPWVDTSRPSEVLAAFPNLDTPYNNVNVYGVPLVVGVKKGYPNFNEFHFQTSVQVARELRGRKLNPGSRPEFRQVYEVGVSNLMGMELWNAYTNTYRGPLALRYQHVASIGLRDVGRGGNDANQLLASFTLTNQAPAAGVSFVDWEPQKFQVPFTNLVTTLSQRPYYPQFTPVLKAINSGPLNFVNRPAGFQMPDIKLDITNRIWVALVDETVTPHRVVDFVNLSDMWSGMDVTRALVGQTNTLFNSSTGPNQGTYFLTNLVNIPELGLAGVPEGVASQIRTATNDTSNAIWRNYRETVNLQSKRQAIDTFRKWMGYDPLFNTADTTPVYAQEMQVPFTPYQAMHIEYSWQADDPLVHYHRDDLYEEQLTSPFPPRVRPLRDHNNLGYLNIRYRPWGGENSYADVLGQDLAAKDPLVTQADDWNFPNHPLPTVGWLGRIHRGTPWQTVYLKSKVIPPDQWQKRFFTRETHPTNDWALLDLFTTAVHPNADRGRLSVNQTNIAAWAAVLSGVQVLTNSQPSSTPSYTAMTIEPRSVLDRTLVSPQLEAIVQNINETRSLQPGGSFRTLGHVLATPALTVASPFLDHGQSDVLTDVMYEWLPQQILSLLKEDEPYIVVYAYGQALKPADRSIVSLPGQYQGLCTNYQIAGEALIKAGIRFSAGTPPGGPTLYNATVEDYKLLSAD